MNNNNYTEKEIKLIARTKEILIRANTVCCMCKDLYYNYNTIAIADYEYDMLEHRIRYLTEISGIDIDNDVKYNVIKHPGYPVNDVEFDTEELIKDVINGYNIITKLLMDVTALWLHNMVDELNALCEKYNISEKDLKTLDKQLSDGYSI